MEIGNIEVFLEELTIASACNKMLRKKFLKPETIGLIPSGGYSANNKKALIWLLHMKQTDGELQHVLQCTLHNQLQLSASCLSSKLSTHTPILHLIKLQLNVFDNQCNLIFYVQKHTIKSSNVKMSKMNF